MVWIRQQQARPLAVVAAWIGALLPWNLTYSSGGGIGVLFIRFPFFEFQYTSGAETAINGATVRSVLGAMFLQSGRGLESATLVWGGGAVVMLVALVLSVACYENTPRLESLSIHPVRLMGGLLGVASVLFSVATVFVWTGGFGGTPIPIGVLLMAPLAWILLRGTIVDEAETAAPTDPETESAPSEADTEPSVD